MDFDGFGAGAYDQLKIRFGDEGDGDGGLPFHVLEAGDFDADAILSGRQIDDAIETALVRGGAGFLIGPEIHRSDGSIANGGAGRVRDCAGNVARDFLGKQGKAWDQAG